MSTTNTTINETYQLILSGPTTKITAITIRAKEGEAVTAASLPSSSLVGHVFLPNFPFQFELLAGENLYVRTRSGGGEAVLVIE